ncbi:MAG: LysM peptidoglycan-binding domain-containing protein [Anaerolineae bacterium]
MDNNSIEALEQRYQILYGDYQAGKIDEAMFIAEVDKLQFQDQRSRFWMIGAQSGNWHYYDGQNWQQADPRDADNLPFVDEQGRYWQRGVKSGDWYYYNPDTKEWVKPSPTGDSRPVPVFNRGDSSAARPPSSTTYPTQPQPYQQPDYSAGSDAPQFDGELFQDDEGRYWAIGAKTGQWYFYDHTGWRPAHEFQPANPAPYQPTQPYQPQPPVYPTPSYYAQPPQTFYQTPPDPWGQAYATPAYQPPAPGYAYPPQQPIYQQPAPPPTYGTPPVPGYPAPAPQAEPAPQPAPADKMPAPPGGESQSGSWFFFDGKQWLQYASGEPAATATPPKMVIDQDSPATPEAKPAKPKAETKSEPVVAEIIEEDEPAVEVVDVEVITVIDPEPEPAPKVRAAAPKESAASTPLDKADEIEPRQPRRTSETMRVRPAVGEPQRQGRDRMPTDPRLLGSGRQEGAHQPTVIIPTVSTPQIAAPVARAASKPMPVQPRRARENTVPMEPAPVQEAAVSSPVDRRAMTQPMPQTSVAREARSETMPMPAQAVKKEAVQPTSAAAMPLAGQPAPLAQPQKEGHTLGDVLRAIPSTVWTFTGGIVALLIFAVLVIVGYSFFVNSNETGVPGVAVLQSPTPTLEAGPPNATPTLGPTPTSSPEPVTTPTAFSMATLSSPAMGITIDYPEGWKKKEGENQVIMSPSTDGLDADALKDVAMRIGSPAGGKSEIKELLAEVLAAFPANPKTLNEGTISIGSQTWTSTQIRFENKELGGEGIATIAVTNKEGKGYYLVAVAPADRWNPTQPVFQKMINSFRFGAKEPAVAQAATTPATSAQATKASTTTVTSAVVTGTTTLTATKESTATQTTPVAATTKTTPTPVPTPTPKATATPLVYVVQQGDSLLAIANKFGVDVDTLAAKNDLDDPGKLSLGQELIIPFTPEQLAAGSGQDNAAPEAAEASSKPAAEEGDAPAAAATPEAEQAAAAKESSAPTSAPAAVTGRIVYPAFNPGTNTFDLWLADVATGEQTGIASGASQPAFNKDGSLLAYRSWNLDTRGIFFRDFIGGRGGQVTKFVEDGLPTWSPDGFSFAFATRREGDRVPRIYKGDQNGKNDFSLNFQGEYVSTLPDGRLVVKGCLPSGDCGIFIIGATGGSETKISTEQSDTAPMPSPDGKKIVFMSSGRGGSNWEIWVMDVSGANPKRLTSNGNNDGLPTWSPDGKNIAYVSDAEGVWAVWVMNADGSNQRKLFNMKGAPDGVVLRDRDNSKGWTEERISWAP